MKKFLIVVLMLATFGISVEIMPTAEASQRSTSVRRRRIRHRRTFWQKHRDKLTVAGSAVGGAAIGGIAGGRKGAAIGAAGGAGAGAVYTYGVRKRHHRRHRRQ